MAAFLFLKYFAIYILNPIRFLGILSASIASGTGINAGSDGRLMQCSKSVRQEERKASCFLPGRCWEGKEKGLGQGEVVMVSSDSGLMFSKWRVWLKKREKAEVFLFYVLFGTLGRDGLQGLHFRRRDLMTPPDAR